MREQIDVFDDAHRKYLARRRLRVVKKESKVIMVNKYSFHVTFLIYYA